jgi:hypothetical protein
VLNRPLEIDAASGGLGPKFAGAISFQDVTFTYGGTGAATVNLAVEHGQEALDIGRVAGLDDDIEDQAAAAGGQIELVSVLHVAAALDDDVGVRLELHTATLGTVLTGFPAITVQRGLCVGACRLVLRSSAGRGASRDRWFEFISLQRGVSCEPDFLPGASAC